MDSTKSIAVTPTSTPGSTTTVKTTPVRSHPTKGAERCSRLSPLGGAESAATSRRGIAAPVAVGLATRTVAVGVVVVGSEQFPDPPAGTPPTETAPKDPPDLCRSCR